MLKEKTPIKKFANNLTKFLDQSKARYNLLEHKIVYTAYDLAQTTKKKINEIAKVVLIKSGKDLALIVLPAGKYVDLKAVQKALASARGGSASGGKKVSMATEKDIAKYLKTKIGLIHPFGSLYKLPPHPSLSPLFQGKGGARGILVLLDKSLAKSKKLIASAGSYTQSVEIGLKDFEKLVKPLKGIFSKGKR